MSDRRVCMCVKLGERCVCVCLHLCVCVSVCVCRDGVSMSVYM